MVFGNVPSAIGRVLRSDHLKGRHELSLKLGGIHHSQGSAQCLLAHAPRPIEARWWPIRAVAAVWVNPDIDSPATWSKCALCTLVRGNYLKFATAAYLASGQYSMTANPPRLLERPVSNLTSNTSQIRFTIDQPRPLPGWSLPSNR